MALDQTGRCIWMEQICDLNMRTRNNKTMRRLFFFQEILVQTGLDRLVVWIILRVPSESKGLVRPAEKFGTKQLDLKISLKGHWHKHYGRHHKLKEWILQKRKRGEETRKISYINENSKILWRPLLRMCNKIELVVLASHNRSSNNALQ